MPVRNRVAFISVPHSEHTPQVRIFQYCTISHWHWKMSILRRAAGLIVREGPPMGDPCNKGYEACWVHIRGNSIYANALVGMAI